MRKSFCILLAIPLMICAMGTLALAQTADEQNNPMLEVLAPPNEATISGNQVQISVSFKSDEKRPVSKIQVYLDGQSITERVYDTPQVEGVCEFKWDTVRTPNGRHKLDFQAFSQDEYLGMTSCVVMVMNRPTDLAPPRVAVMSPKEGETISGVTPIIVEASDNSGVEPYVTIYVDKSLRTMKNHGPYTYDWDTSGEENGPHTIEVMAADETDNKMDAKSVRVIVRNPIKQISITSEPGTQSPVIPEVSVAPLPELSAPTENAASTATPMQNGTTVQEPARTAPTAPAEKFEIPQTPATVTAPEAPKPAPVAQPAPKPAPVVEQPKPKPAAQPSTPAPKPVPMAVPAPKPVVVPPAPKPIPVEKPAPAAPKPATSAVIDKPAPKPAAAPKPAVEQPKVKPAVKAEPKPTVAPKPQPKPAAVPAVKAEPKPVLMAKKLDTEKAVPAVAPKPVAQEKPAAAPKPAPVVQKPAPKIAVEKPAPKVAATPKPAAKPVLIAKAVNEAPKVLIAKASVPAVTSPKPAAKTGCATYTIRPGDTLDALSKKFGVSIAAIAELNKIEDPRLIIAGDKLMIPAQISMVQLRPVFEDAGGTLIWQNGSKMVHAVCPENDVTLKIGSAKTTVNSKPVTMERPASIQSGRTLVSEKFVTEILGMASGK